MKRITLAAALVTTLSLLPLIAQADVVSLETAASPISISNPLSCFDLHTTLTTESQSYEVRGLQYDLLQEGFKVSPSEFGTFGADTLAAVNAFQQKYASDILPGGDAPTGLVGRLSRAKLNALHGCGVAMAPAVKASVPSKIVLTVKSTALDSTGVTATFCNNSPTDIPMYPVRLRLNGVIRDFSVTGAVKAGACDTETLPYATWGLSYDAATTFNLVTGIDPLNMYKSSQLSYPAVGTTTLAVPAVTGAHLSVRGVAIKSNGLQATVCNLGTTDLTSYPVRVTINGVTKDLDVPGAYAHGICPSVTWTYDQFGLAALPPSGTLINASVNVDPNNVYKETNEFDNSATVLGNI